MLRVNYANNLSANFVKLFDALAPKPSLQLSPTASVPAAIAPTPSQRRRARRASINGATGTIRTAWF